MKTLRRSVNRLLALVLTSAIALVGCAYCQAPANKNTAICKAGEVAKNCADPAVQKLVMQILPTAIVDLLSQNWVDLLGHLVDTLKSQGVADALAVVNCAIATANDNAEPAPGAALSPETVTVKAHAQAWLASHR